MTIFIQSNPRSFARRVASSSMAALWLALVMVFMLSPASGPALVAQEVGTPQAKTGNVADEKLGATDEAAAARKKLLADTHLLLSLSRELQAEAAKSTPNTFSLRMVKKSEEIQKLAAVVRAEVTNLR